MRGLDGGFTGLDRSVLHTMTEWLQRQLEQEMVVAVAAGREDKECSLMNALGGLFTDQGMLASDSQSASQCYNPRAIYQRLIRDCATSSCDNQVLQSQHAQTCHNPQFSSSF